MLFRPTHHIRASIILLCGWQWLLLWLCAGLACSAQAAHGVSAFASGTPFAAFTYISQIHETAPVNAAWPAKDWNYGYDAADNLISIAAPTATTDFTVNTVNTVNQVTDRNGVAYSYDANGNLTDDGNRSYQWDADNRLLQFGYKAQPSQSTQFRYDGLGRRVAIISKNGTLSRETRYLWCGEQLCQARTAADAVSRRYYPQGEVRLPAGNLLYYSRDHLGSVRDVHNIYNGARIASFDYDAYGKETQTTGRLSTDFRYAGMFYLQEAGLYLTQYRVYDPDSGRWLSRDPIEEAGALIYTRIMTSMSPCGQPNKTALSACK